MKQDRFLTGILIGIGVLIVVALAAFFTRSDTSTYKPDDAPESVVHNYVLALLNKDYQKAYGYIADLENKPTFNEFRQSFLNYEARPDNVGVSIGDAVIIDDVATVDVEFIYSSSDPFSTGYRNYDSATLLLQNGSWKLTSMPRYNFWGYSWYEEK